MTDRYFGNFGGAFVPETLRKPLSELEKAFEEAKGDRAFQKRLTSVLEKYAGRPTPLTYCENLTKKIGGAGVYAKREDLCHTGAHKINNAFGQALLAKRMGKSRVIAETGAGQHGVATATACARLGLPATVYMGSKDVERQKLNVERMRLLGAKVREVNAGTKTLKEATSEAIRDWVSNPEETFYVLGSAVGPHPYPKMAKHFHKRIGEEAKEQLQAKPDAIVACVGGGSNAIGIFAPFIGDPGVELHGAEAAGGEEKTAATISEGTDGIFQGTKTKLLQTEDGQIRTAESVSAGLDYPAVGPEHARLGETGRAKYHPVPDAEALRGVQVLSETEGIIPALETAHAVPIVEKVAKKIGKGGKVVFNCSGRGDKDMETIAKNL
jgi:tryptophan synthase beta chain